MPAYVRFNDLDQALDIAGSLTQSDTRTLSNEPDGYGAPVVGQSGAAASITTVTLGIATITGLTGMTLQSVGQMLTLSGAASVSNNGTFLIVNFISATSVEISNATAVAADANNGAISWVERQPYSLEDDINYIRTDRRLIKGTTNWYDPIPTYQRPTAVGTNVPANLSNISSKTMDAHAWVTNRVFRADTVAQGEGSTIITSPGNLKHADATDRTGIPVFDGADAGNWESTYVEVINPFTENYLIAIGGAADGYRIFGRTVTGVSTSPNSVEIEFRAVEFGADISTSIPYTWDGYQPTTIDLYYPYRQRVDLLEENMLRTTLINGLFAPGSEDTTLRQVVGVPDGATSLAGLLTNIGPFFPFYNLPDLTPTVVDALNTLNQQIGNRDYTGTILTDGYTITQSLQQLADAIDGSTFTRIIERLASDINANVAHTLPGGYTYTPDPTNNGQNLVVYTRGLLRDPGPVVDDNDYSETSTTQITFYSKIKKKDHINYFIYL